MSEKAIKVMEAVAKAKNRVSEAGLDIDSPSRYVTDTSPAEITGGQGWSAQALGGAAPAILFSVDYGRKAIHDGCHLLCGQARKRNAIAVKHLC
jgi:hypothetical protein